MYKGAVDPLEQTWVLYDFQSGLNTAKQQRGEGATTASTDSGFTVTTSSGPSTFTNYSLLGLELSLGNSISWPSLQLQQIIFLPF